MTSPTDALQLVDATDVWPVVSARAGRSGLVRKDLAAVLRRCRRRQAVCMAGADGVVVMTAKIVRGTMSLWVLLAVATGVPGAFARNEAEILRWAREMDASRVVFHSARRGWARMLGPAWRFDGEFYARDV